MNNEHRLTATRYIWVTFFLALLITNASVIINGQAPVVENVIMTVIVAMAASGTSVAVWANQKSASSDEEMGDTKLKRGERVTRLIDLMDDDELYELRKRLSKEVADPADDYITLGDDGELHHNSLKN